MYIFIAIVVSLFINIIAYFVMKRSFEKKFSPQSVLASIKREVLSLINDIEVESDKNFTIFENKVETLQNILLKAEEVEKNLSKSLKKSSSIKKENPPVVVELKSTKKNDEATFDVESPSALYEAQQIQEEMSSKEQADLFSNVETSKKQTNIQNSFKNDNTDVHLKQNPLIKQVNELSGEGFNSEFIAEKLSISISEVNLMLSMK